MSQIRVVKNHRDSACVACDKPIDNYEKPIDTCSPRCAAILASSTRYVAQLNSKYYTPEKIELRKRILDHVCFVKNQACFVNILDLYGTGLFVDAVVDQIDADRIVHAE